MPRNPDAQKPRCPEAQKPRCPDVHNSRTALYVKAKRPYSIKDNLHNLKHCYDILYGDVDKVMIQTDCHCSWTEVLSRHTVMCYIVLFITTCLLITFGLCYKFVEIRNFKVCKFFHARNKNELELRSVSQVSRALPGIAFCEENKNLVLYR